MPGTLLSAYILHPISSSPQPRRKMRLRDITCFAKDTQLISGGARIQTQSCRTQEQHTLPPAQAHLLRSHSFIRTAGHLPSARPRAGRWERPGAQAHTPAGTRSCCKGEGHRSPRRILARLPGKVYRARLGLLGPGPQSRGGESACG